MPPVRNAAATREKLLSAARAAFLQESYDNVGLRDVARGAGVDVALIGRYFGSKEELFRAVLRKEDDDWSALAAAADDLPAYLAHSSTSDAARDTEHVENLLIMLRSAASPQAAAIVRSAFHSGVLEPFAKVIGGDDAETRAVMAMSVLIGTTVLRTILKLEEPYECGADIFRERLAHMLAAALTHQQSSA